MDDDYELVSRDDIHRLKEQLNKSKGSDNRLFISEWLR